MIMMGMLGKDRNRCRVVLERFQILYITEKLIFRYIEIINNGQKKSII
jgi:hypothetical protein